MSEYMQKRWKCDYCGRDVKRGVMPPPGWQEVVCDQYGNVTHCCADQECAAKLDMFCRENLIGIYAELTDEERRNLKTGDRVLVRDDVGNESVYVVKYPPWQLGHGAWVIGLAGISGGYSLDRVVKIFSTAEKQ